MDSTKPDLFDPDFEPTDAQLDEIANAAIDAVVRKAVAAEKRDPPKRKGAGKGTTKVTKPPLQVG